MNDDDCALTVDISHFDDDRRRVGTNHHGEPVPEVPDPDGIAVRVEDLVFAEPVLERGLGDEGFVHTAKLTCFLDARQRPRHQRESFTGSAADGEGLGWRVRRRRSLSDGSGCRVGRFGFHCEPGWTRSGPVWHEGPVAAVVGSLIGPVDEPPGPGPGLGLAGWEFPRVLSIC
jgi:hypothetical protein